ncbi:Zn-ribbon domain-containing OB-fold protein [Rhodococcus sp. NPDC003318]|uniref:Zn-ribbon domain-containing OB-fold protein n=1 Tax=Rhodococcus sp. NPDC003318 TaxID=3364503 RepID=UPI0036CA1B7D
MPENPHTAAGADHRRPLDPGTLLVKQCTACTTLYAPLTEICPTCGSTDLTAIPSPGTGAIVSWKAAPGGSPAVNAIVELDEGPLIYTWVEGDIPDLPDRRVRVRFRPSSPGDRFPVFAVNSCDAPIRSGTR